MEVSWEKPQQLSSHSRIDGVKRRMIEVISSLLFSNLQSVEDICFEAKKMYQMYLYSSKIKKYEVKVSIIDFIKFQYEDPNICLNTQE